MSSSFYNVESTFIVQSATASKVPTIMADYGNDVVLGGGGAIHGHPDGVTSGVRAIKQAIELTMSEIPLEEGSREYPELSKALELNKPFNRPQQERF